MRKQLLKNTRITGWGKVYPLLAGLVLVGVLRIGQMAPLASADLKLMDLAFRIRGPRAVPPEIVILAIDEDSFRKIDEPFVLWNGNYALILKLLAQAGAKTVGIDIIQPKSFDRFTKDENQRLLEVIDDIISGGSMNLAFSYLPDKGLYPFDELFAMLAEAGALGYANLTMDRDKIVRRQELFVIGEERLIPSLSLLIASSYLDTKPQLLVENKIKERKCLYGGSKNLLNINFRGPAETFPRISFVQALAKAKLGDLSYFRENFADRIVLVGLDTAEDVAPVAYSGLWERSVLMPGIEIHANTISTMLTGETIREVEAFSLWGFPFLLFAILLCILFARLSLGIGLVLTFTVGTVSIIFWYVLFSANVYLGLAAPLAMIVLAPFTTYSYRFLVEDKNKRRLHRMFRTYVNENVLEELMARDDPAVFEVRRSPITLMFTDIRNFTTLSEPMPPESVARLLNEYMTEMCKAIFEFGGTVNKFMGDGIMAMWGAPTADPDGCYHAVRSALRMLELLEELNQRWESQGLPKLRIGVGIHYAVVAVGYIGHPDRMEYTALGDGVNTASRVEGLNKQLKTSILATESIYELVKDQILVGKSETMPIKGRSDIRVYEVLGMEGDGA